MKRVRLFKTLFKSNKTFKILFLSTKCRSPAGPPGAQGSLATPLPRSPVWKYLP